MLSSSYSTFSTWRWNILHSKLNAFALWERFLLWTFSFFYDTIPAEVKMVAMRKIVNADTLSSLFDMPHYLRHRQVEVIILPLASDDEVAPITESPFQAHIRKKVEGGGRFDFDVDKVLAGTETENEIQQRFALEKSAWHDHVVENAARGKYDAPVSAAASLS